MTKLQFPTKNDDPLRRNGPIAPLTNLGKAASENNPIVSESYKHFYDNMNAQREKAIRSSKDKNEVEQINKMLDEAVDYATKIMLANAKNAGDPFDENNSKSKEMSDSANAISQMMATKVSVKAQMHAIEAQKKPAIDLMKLKGKIIEYSENSKDFSGQPIKFNYKISHNYPNDNVSIKLKLTIKDELGRKIKTENIFGKVGDQVYEWDGKNDFDRIAAEGKYILTVEAYGSKLIDDKSITIPIQASTNLSGRVEGYKIENGTAIGVYVRDNLVTRDQISNVTDYDINEVNKNFFSASLIGQNVGLDLSKAILKGGVMEVYYNNELGKDSHAKAGALKVDIYDYNNKLVKTVKSETDVIDDFGKMKFTKLDLKDDEYNLKIYIENNVDGKITNKEINYNKEINVKSINILDREITDFANNNFSANMITSIIGSHLSPTLSEGQKYLGRQIHFKNNIFKYNPHEETKFIFTKTENDAAIVKGLMNIYDLKNNELIASVSGEVDIYDYLNDESKAKLRNYLSANYNTPEFSDIINKDELYDIYYYIEREIEKGELNFIETNNQIDVNRRLVKFNKWDGAIDQLNLAFNGQEFKREFVPIYFRPYFDENNGAANSNSSSSKEFYGPTDIEAAIGEVESIDEEAGKLLINVYGDQQISEEDIIAVR